MQKWRYTLSDQTIIQLGVLSFIAGFLLLLPACSPSLQVTEPSASRVLPVTDSRDIPQVIKNLLEKADLQYSQGKYSDSLVTLERAVRIKPRFPEVWSRMAQIYYQQGNFQQARQHAERSNNYIKSNEQLELFNKQLIDSIDTGVQH